jgi:hypothetical protein
LQVLPVDVDGRARRGLGDQRDGKVERDDGVDDAQVGELRGWTGEAEGVGVVENRRVDVRVAGQFECRDGAVARANTSCARARKG